MITGANVAAGRVLLSDCHFKIAPACVFAAINCTANGDAAAESPGSATCGIAGAATGVRTKSRVESERAESGLIATVGCRAGGLHGVPAAASAVQFG
jgi:hypothetical protein